jgi:hypothetical protein
MKNKHSEEKKNYYKQNVIFRLWSAYKYKQQHIKIDKIDLKKNKILKIDKI